MMDSLVLIALFFCHFLGDFSPLSTKKMNQAKSVGKPIGPIALHALIHGLLVALICLLLSKAIELTLILLSFQFVTHFIIDFCKAKLTSSFSIFRDQSRKPFWMLFGFDQFLHAVVMILIWAEIVS